jgi:peptide-methionine (S)-S-oxide reductase
MWPCAGSARHGQGESVNSSGEIITLGGGCFWCLEAVYQSIRGIHQVESGYANGAFERPTYEQVCSGSTGHNEVVQVHFDPEVIGLTQVLEVFFHVHDPTTLNRQGNDVGTQYRSGIYYSQPSQLPVAQQVLTEAQAAHGGRVVTELLPLRNYARAEDYHQRYFEKHPHQGYCAFVVAPKVEKFRRSFASLLKPS